MKGGHQSGLLVSRLGTANCLWEARCSSGRHPATRVSWESTDTYVGVGVCELPPRAAVACGEGQQGPPTAIRAVLWSWEAPD